MKKIVLLLAIVGIGVSIFPSIASVTEQETFIDPLYKFRSGAVGGVDPCIDSFRYEDKCSKAASGKVAQEYCEYKGFTSWVKWQSRSMERSVSNAKYTEKYVDGELWEGWVLMSGRWRMSVIVCAR